jgi:hypothetical protein
MTPLEVDTIATPRPFNTLGIEEDEEYFRSPGLEALCKEVIAGILVIALYFNAIFMVP